VGSRRREEAEIFGKVSNGGPPPHVGGYFVTGPGRGRRGESEFPLYFWQGLGFLFQEQSQK